MNRRDIFQRKAYATYRMHLAARRAILASTPAEQDRARVWEAVWGVASGIRRFKLGNGGGQARQRKA
ncbi:hypothetical protein ABC383_24285 [Noviherbaspirillum sp. 1P10PC]|uniref:hypothetical protein n=1 Tax=Noviherbaspirillum sp. 1P10PC TaxID=3132292 RepID=UPI0039A1602A